MAFTSPFSKSASKPGHGKVTLSVLPPRTPVFSELSYQYPLKLVAPDPVPLPNWRNTEHKSQNDTKPEPSNLDPSNRDHSSHHEPPQPPPLIHTLFLLTYGGGIVAGDTVHLHITLHPSTRLNLLTQGSTKIFKTPDPRLVSEQKLVLDVWPGAALCYLPDPVQPFRDSAFRQGVEVRFLGFDEEKEGGKEGRREDGKGDADRGWNICILDWVSGGRGARGENWDFFSYESRNEVYSVPLPSSPSSTTPSTSISTTPTPPPPPKRRLLLRDTLLLHPPTLPSHRLQPYTIYATLILHGPLFESLGSFFLSEFGALPRLGVGSRRWDTQSAYKYPTSTSTSSTQKSKSGDEISEEQQRTVDREKDLSEWRAQRVESERADGVIWSAARVRGGFVLVKVAGRGGEGVRDWVRDMVTREGSLVEGFGERAGMCLK